MVKLIAERWICEQTPKGARFECPDKDALILIELGHARKDDTLEASDLQASSTSSTPSRRTYRRRDLKAEGTESGSC